MIGMMNGGTADVPVEFYGSRPNLIHGAPSVYSKPKLSQTLSYTQDGRILINGQPVVYETPEAQWQSLVLRIRTKIVCEKHLNERKTRKFKNLFSRQTSLRSLRSVLSSGSRRSKHCSPSKLKNNRSKDKVVEEQDGDGGQKNSSSLPKLFTSMFLSRNGSKRRKHNPVAACKDEVIPQDYSAQLAKKMSEEIDSQKTHEIANNNYAVTSVRIGKD